MMIAAMRVGVRDSAAALGLDKKIVGVCAQERVMRVRGGPTPGGVPDDALDLLLQRAGRTRGEIRRMVQIGGAAPVAAAETVRLDDHFAHACTAYLTSPFDRSTIVICDHDAPGVSVWLGRDGTIAPAEVEWSGPGFSEAYARCALALGFPSDTATQRFEALARLRPDARDPRVDRLFDFDGDALRVDPALDRVVADLGAGAQSGNPHRRAELAASLESRIADLLVGFLERVRNRTGLDNVCLGGSLFYHSSINTRVRAAGVFADAFVPVDPGDAGVVAGAVLHGCGGVRPESASPFLGPAYSSEETKEVLDNCKLQYAWESESAILADVVDALMQGRLVAWFDAEMEWGPRSLGARSILASPFAPYVLENLNRFLKHREPWRGYALSGLKEAVGAHFKGPADAPFMECDYRPLDPAAFRHVLPSDSAAVRLHTVGGEALPRFARLLEAFGTASGLPFLVNTSFNGFHEPAVCSPRDAVRVFYGSGLDMLVMNGFVLRK